MDPVKEAKSKLVWYFRMLAQKAGIVWNGDNEYEVESIVDEILRAAGMQADEKNQAMQKQIESLQGRLDRIEAVLKISAE